MIGDQLQNNLRVVYSTFGSFTVKICYGRDYTLRRYKRIIQI